MARHAQETADQQRISVKLFGPISVAVGGTKLGPRDFGGVKPKQILEVLLAARGHSVSKDRLADQLWGESLPRNVSGTLETYVSVLRRRIEPNKGRGSSILVTEPGAYRLNADLVDIDIDEFDELVQQASRSSDHSSRRLLEQALMLVRGEILEDEPYAEWADPLRNQYRQAVTQALLDAAELALSEHDHHAALAHSQQAINVDPLNERAYRTMMLASYALGRQRDAIHAYEQCDRMLMDELGVEPLEKTRQLHDSIRAQVDAASLLPQRSEGSIDVMPHESDDAVAFLGRSAELKRATDVVETALSGRFSVSFIEGVSGSGRTRFLEELAKRLPLVQVLRTSCNELESGIPFSALAGLLSKNLADFYEDGEQAEELEAAGTSGLSHRDQATLLDTVIEELSYNAPLVVLIDDIQWADAASIATLSHAQRRCANLPIAVVATVGTDSLTADSTVNCLRPNDRFIMEPLTAEEVGSGQADELMRRTGGHASYLTAYLSTDDHGGGVPDEVRDSIMARAAAEGPQRYKVLLSASVMEGSFTSEIVARLVDAGEEEVVEELEVLCAHRLLVCEGDSFRFFGTDVSAVLASTLSGPRRRLLERKAATFEESSSFSQLSRRPAMLRIQSAPQMSVAREA